MSQYTGPAIPTNGSHVHEFTDDSERVESLLDIYEDSYIGPRTYEIGASVPPIPHVELGASVPPIPHVELGKRLFAKKPVKVVAHTRYYPGDPYGKYGELDVVSHTRLYPDVWGEIGASVPPIPHVELGASVPPIPHVELGLDRISNKLLKIPAHERYYPGDPKGTYGVVEVVAHKRHYPAVWGSDEEELYPIYEIGRLEIGAAHEAFDRNPPQLTGKLRCFVKDGKLVAMAEIIIPVTGEKIHFALTFPMSLIRTLDASASAANVSGDWDMYDRPVEIGWGWKKYVRKAIRKTVKHPAFKKLIKKTKIRKYAKKLGRKAKRTARNPYVQKYGQVAAVAVAAYYGVPPKVTLAATDTLFQAINGDPVAMEKIAIIASEAAEGNKTAKKLKGLMTILYKGGMKEMKPYLSAGQQASIKSFTSKVIAVPPGDFALPGKARGMFPFTIPGFSWGPPISGWLYNVPYRSNLAALSVDKKNPFHILRGAYHKGMQ